jgi:hypothetical protein
VVVVVAEAGSNSRVWLKMCVCGRKVDLMLNGECGGCFTADVAQVYKVSASEPPRSLSETPPQRALAMSPSISAAQVQATNAFFQAMTQTLPY